MVLKFNVNLVKVEDLTPIEDSIAVSISIDPNEIKTLEFNYNKGSFKRNHEPDFKDEHDYFVYLLAQKAMDEFKVKDVPLLKLYGKILPPFAKRVGYVESEKLLGCSIVLNNHQDILKKYIDTDCGTNENKDIYDPDLLHKKKLLTDQSVIVHSSKILHYEGYLPGSESWMKIKKNYASRKKFPYISGKDRRYVEGQIMNLASFPPTVGTRTRSGITISHLNKHEDFAYIMRSQSTGIITQIGARGIGKRKLMFAKVADSCSEKLKDYIVVDQEDATETKKNVVLLEVRYGLKKKGSNRQKNDTLYVKEAYLVSPKIITERLE